MMEKAILFVNIGTPEELQLKSVKSYLKNFLMDKYVIDIPFFIRWFLVNCIIVPFRSKKSLEAYKAIWKKEGSPLEIYTKNLVKKASKELEGRYLVDYAMSYSAPFIKDKLSELKAKGVKEIYYLPMYPQYAESTSRSSIEEAKKWQSSNLGISLKFRDYYFNDPSFVNASVDFLKENLKVEEDAFYLFSYHGLPERHVKKLYPSYCKNQTSCCENWEQKNEFCYRAQCIQTTLKLSKELGLKNYASSFQSRLGQDKWLKPYTVDKVAELAQSGVKNLVVIPWAFTIDCLETEEEIEEEIKEAFIGSGGKSFTRALCLNEDFSKVLTDEFLSRFK